MGRWDKGKAGMGAGQMPCAGAVGRVESGVVKVTVYVTPKKNVLDPQGEAVGHAMESLGHKPASPVRVGKTIEFELAAGDTPKTRAELDKLCQELLSNPVIEDYRYEVTEGQV